MSASQYSHCDVYTEQLLEMATLNYNALVVKEDKTELNILK